MDLSVISSGGTQVHGAIASALGPAPTVPVSPSAQVQVISPEETMLIKRIVLAATQAVYAIIDALQRIAASTDGVDKSLKFFSGLSVWMLASGMSELFWQQFGDKINYVDRIFTAVALFGRVNEFTGVDANGNFTAGKKIRNDPLKMANTFFLALNKTCEMGRLLQNVGIWTTQGAVAFDANYLGGIAARVGGGSVIGRVAFNAGLGSCKNAFLVTACIFSITNNSISIARSLDKARQNNGILDWLKNSENARFDLARLALSIGADTGKILLVAMTYAISFTFAAVAIATAVFSLAKIVMDSYKKDWERMKEKRDPEIIWGPNYPQWMRA